MESTLEPILYHSFSVAILTVLEGNMYAMNIPRGAIVCVCVRERERAGGGGGGEGEKRVL